MEFVACPGRPSGVSPGRVHAREEIVAPPACVVPGQLALEKLPQEILQGRPAALGVALGGLQLPGSQVEREAGTGGVANLAAALGCVVRPGAGTGEDFPGLGLHAAASAGGADSQSGMHLVAESADIEDGHVFIVGIGGDAGNTNAFSMTIARIQIDLPAEAAPWRLTAASQERGEIASVTSTWTPPDADPAPPRQWRHAGREESPLDLAGVAGAVVADRFETSGYELRREVWQAHDRGSAAVRHPG